MSKNTKKESIIEVFSCNRIQYFDKKSYQFFVDIESQKLLKELEKLDAINFSINSHEKTKEK